VSHIYGARYEDAADLEDGAREQSAKDWAREQEGADIESPMPLMRCPSCNEPLLTNMDRVFRWHTTTPEGYSCYRRAMEIGD